MEPVSSQRAKSILGIPVGQGHWGFDFLLFLNGRYLYIVLMDVTNVPTPKVENELDDTT